MPDDVHVTDERQLPKTLHVITAHAPKPRLRVVPATDPPRTVTYAGVEFEVMFDGTPQRVVVEEP